MSLCTGDYIVQVFGHDGMPIAGGIMIRPTLAEAYALAPDLARLHNADHWRVLRIVAQSTDKARWHNV